MRRPVAQADDDAGTRLAYASTQSAAGRRARRGGFMLPRTQKNYNSRLAMPPRRPMPHARRPRGPPRRFVRASRAARPCAPAASSPRNCLRRIAPHVAGLFE
ncbi:hypothetical protein FFM54_34270 [Burkholderia pseudomallei]|nr:hypothetical protein FFM54_34270 [Burkholderia pseudomallei]